MWWGCRDVDISVHRTHRAFARVRQNSFDGTGNFTSAVQTDYAGSIVPESLAGTNAVNADCTFDIKCLLFEQQDWFGMLADTIFRSQSDSPRGAGFRRNRNIDLS